ncbi:MAG TPA: hypothetical protein VK455_07505 [Thermoplasmata archaeon]|nr:hypothetical protein [Thermoplasmata archaeon]
MTDGNVGPPPTSEGPGPPVSRTPAIDNRLPEDEHRRGGWLELFHNRRFLLLEATGSFAGAGYAVYSVSILFFAYTVTHSLAVAGAVLFIEYGVYTATFLVAPLVDRARDKRTILLLCYPVQAAAAGGLAVGIRTATLSVPVLLALVLVLAVLWDFVWAVFMIAPRIVVEKRQLFVADGVSSVVSVGTTIGGYAGGGALLYFVGSEGGAVAYVVLLALAAAAAIPLSLRIDSPPTTRFWETFRRGWDSFRGSVGRSLRRFSALESLYGFFSAIPPLLITAIAFQRFSDPAAVYGPLVTAETLGGAVAGIGLGHLNPRRAVGILLVAAPVIGGLAVLALVPRIPSVLIVGLILAVVGAAFSVRYTAKYTWVRASFPAEQLGRVTSNLYFFTGVAGSAAVLLVGWSTGYLSLARLELIDGVGLIVAGMVAVSIPFVRRLSF